MPKTKNFTLAFRHWTKEITSLRIQQHGKQEY
jgi:hypothetical protein